MRGRKEEDPDERANEEELGEEEGEEMTITRYYVTKNNLFLMQGKIKKMLTIDLIQCLFKFWCHNL